MKKIGLLSDTHGYINDDILHHLKLCDEIWHAGDFGSLEVIEKLSAIKPLRGVYGNIDGTKIKALFPENLIFNIEGLNIMMQHIGGYPGKYVKGIKEKIIENEIKLFISGHSHILKIMYDNKLNCLHMNPGAAGKQGWHTKRTLIKFEVGNDKFSNCEVVELN